MSLEAESIATLVSCFGSRKAAAQALGVSVRRLDVFEQDGIPPRNVYLANQKAPKPLAIEVNGIAHHQAIGRVYTDEGRVHYFPLFTLAGDPLYAEPGSRLGYLTEKQLRTTLCTSKAWVSGTTNHPRATA